MCLFKKDEQENSCDHEGCQAYYLLKKQKFQSVGPHSESTKVQQKFDSNSNVVYGGFTTYGQTQMTSVMNGYMSQRPGEEISKGGSTQGYQIQNIQVMPTTMMSNERSVPIILNTMPQMNSNGFVQSTANARYIPVVSPPFNQFSNGQSTNQVQGTYTNHIDFKQPENSVMNGNPNQNIIIYQSNKPGNGSNTNQFAEPSVSYNLSHLQEFQSKLFGMIASQGQFMTDLQQRNELLQDTLANLVTEVSDLKTSLVRNRVEDRLSNIPNSVASKPTDEMTAENLLTSLYGANLDFHYQLLLKSDLPLPLYRERNFKFIVILVDKNGVLVENSNAIPLTIGIYSSENPPKYIDTNTSGNKILKGFINKDLSKGAARFDKIQIKEVTSHFRNGWVFFVVYPLSMQVTDTVARSKGFVPSSKIKPLVLERVVVKAKKMKKKEENSEEQGEEEEDEVNKEEELDEVNKGEDEEEPSEKEINMSKMKGEG